MEPIKYYKLISPYEEDETKNCKLTITDLDDNFLAFKNNDIKSFVFDEEEKILTLTRNNGEKLSVDISALNIDAEEIVKNYTAPLEDYFNGKKYIVEDVDIKADLSDDGVLTLTWLRGLEDDSVGEFKISGFLTPFNIPDKTTTNGEGNVGDGTLLNPTRLSNLEKTGVYEKVLGIVSSLPEKPEEGDRYVTSGYTAQFGYLYSKEGIEKINEMLKDQHSIWRIPTKEDWDKLCDYLELKCMPEPTEFHSGTELGEYGFVAGFALKAHEYWRIPRGREGIPYANMGYPEFTAYPAGTSPIDSDELTDANERTVFWTNTKYSENEYYLKALNWYSDKVEQTVNDDRTMYSLRLVCDYKSKEAGFTANVLGNNYDVLNYQDIEMLWLGHNLTLDLGNGLSYAYKDFPNVKKTYYINHWNGSYWERKQLESGNSFFVEEVDSEIDLLQKYEVKEEKEGDYLIFPTTYVRKRILPESDGQMIIGINCGEY